MDANDYTAPLKDLDRHYMEEFARITESDTLTPNAKKEQLEKKKAEYREAWLAKRQEVEQALQSRGEDLYKQAYPSDDPPSDPQRAMLVELKRGRIRDMARNLKDTPGRALGLYEQAIKQGDATAAKEWEAVLPSMLPEEMQKDFSDRAKKEQRARMSDSERRAHAQLEEFHRQHEASRLGLELQHAAPTKGHLPTIPNATEIAAKPVGFTYGGMEYVKRRGRAREEQAPLRAPAPTEVPDWIKGAGRGA